MDSADDDVFGVWDWDDIEAWLVGEDDDQEEFEAFSALSNKDPAARGSMVPHLEGVWEVLNSCGRLAEYWGDYLGQARWALGPAGRGPQISAKAFFAAHSEAIADAVLRADDDGKMDGATVRDIVENFAIVGNFHSLGVPKRNENRAIALMALVVSSSYSYYGD